jgi:hypothetical protein
MPGAGSVSLPANIFSRARRPIRIAADGRDHFAARCPSGSGPRHPGCGCWGRGSRTH